MVVCGGCAKCAVFGRSGGWRRKGRVSQKYTKKVNPITSHIVCGEIYGCLLLFVSGHACLKSRFHQGNMGSPKPQQILKVRMPRPHSIIILFQKTSLLRSPRHFGIRVPNTVMEIPILHWRADKRFVSGLSHAQNAMSVEKKTNWKNGEIGKRD